MSEYLLLFPILIPFLGAFFVLISKNDKNYSYSNIYNVAIWSLISNVITILYVFSKLDVERSGIQIVEKYSWLKFPPMDILLGTDVFSMLLLLGINFSFLVAEFCIDRTTPRAKILIISELLFISLVNGYLLSADIISLYMFFASISMPLIILISTYGSFRKKNILIRFSLYSFIGTFLLFIAIVMIYNLKSGNIPLNTVANISIHSEIQYFIWFSIFFALISRMPVWPFHYWITSINSTLKNPLVFIIGNLIPLVGLYGFIRFWPNTVPEIVERYSLLFASICVATMLFMSIISINHKDFRYKLYIYITIYYLFYLIGIFLPTSILKLNIGYSLFSFLIIITNLSFLISHIEKQKKKLNLYAGLGILCYMPKASKCISLLVLAGIGLPITPLFWNNFIILTEIFNYNLILGTLVMFSLFVIAVSLLEELYRMKDKNFASSSCVLGVDIANNQFVLYITCIIILFFSFFKPLWFIF